MTFDLASQEFVGFTPTPHQQELTIFIMKEEHALLF